MMYNMHYFGGNGFWDGAGSWGGGGVGFMSGLPVWLPSLFIGFVVWSLFWKGLALWHSAQRGQSWWFIALLLINTAGILDIIYIFFFAKVKIDQLFSRHEHRA